MKRGKDFPKIMVGTLKTQEKEFTKCKKVIESQNYPNFEHVVIENLPNKKAHKLLFDLFLNSEKDFDMLVKVDADTILKDENCLKKIVNDFNNHPEKKHIQYLLHDFFTDRTIKGLNCYRGNIPIKKQDDLYVDRLTNLEENQTLLNKHVIGYHSPNPSDYQAFHFGFHRQLKKQYRVIFDVLISYLITLNYKRKLALIGAMYVRKGELNEKNNDEYEDPKIRNLLKQAKKMSSFQINIKLIWSYIKCLPRYFWQFIKMIARKLNKMF